MDATTGVSIAKTAVDLVKTDNVLNKTTGLMGMLFPYAGIKQKTVNMYMNEIEKADISPEAKVYAALNIKSTFKKIKNQKSIAEIALENAKENTDFSEKSGVNEDWLDRFMDSAGFVSSEELQLVWGKILANEFEKPGSTPPNMIRVLSEITPNMAKAFRTICSMSIWLLPLKEDGNIERNIRRILVPFKGNEDRFRELGVGFDILNELETLGVLKFESIAGYVTKGISNKEVLICVGEKLDVIESHKQNEVPIGNVLLTSVGEALLAITESVEIVGYHDMVKNYLGKENIKFAEEHDFVTRAEGDTLMIERKKA